MIYITGDTHGFHDIYKIETNQKLPELSADDFLVIAGDFGGVWNGDWHDDAVLKFYGEQPYTTLFVDGNHENFDLLNNYPVEQWNGGKIHRITDKVIHLMRGQVFTIEDRHIFTFGGGNSVDKENRTPGESWWPEEEPSDEECNEALENLEKHDFIVDYIITHAAPESIVRNQITSEHKLLLIDCIAEKFLDTVLEKTVYRRWYCGHYHFDQDIKKHRLSVLYQRIVDLKSGNRIK